MINFRRKELELIPCCLECNGKLKDSELVIDAKFCVNQDCSKYRVIVTNWYNFEEFK